MNRESSLKEKGRWKFVVDLFVSLLLVGCFPRTEELRIRPNFAPDPQPNQTPTESPSPLPATPSPTPFPASDLPPPQLNYVFSNLCPAPGEIVTLVVEGISQASSDPVLLSVDGPFIELHQDRSTAVLKIPDDATDPVVVKATLGPEGTYDPYEGCLSHCFAHYQVLYVNQWSRCDL